MEGSVGASVIGMNYQVHILGEVANPGTYRVAASDRVSEIINRAGGLSQYASERNIQLKRKDGGTRVIDLMEFRLHGKLEENPYVTDNDVIYVPLADKLVQIVGSVKRPNYYELKKENTLAQVIDLAGGFNAAAAVSQPIKVVRFVNGEKTINDVPINNDEMDKYAILNGDVIVVPNLVTKDTEFDYNISAIPGDQLFYPSYEDRVFVLGGVTFPGAYPFSQYYMLNQYVSLAGGLSDRGGPKYKVIGVDGKIRKASATDRVNPGDTIMVKEHWLSPAGWMMFGMSLASFGLSASSTALALTRR
jgi:protein involved in polysaccharide export with SLBB domain